MGAALLLAAAAKAGNGGFAPATPHSPNASRINDSYKLIALFTGIILILVEAALVVFVVRYRRGRRPRDAEGPQIRGHTRLELIWTAIPVVVLALIGAYVVYKLPGVQDVRNRHLPRPVRRVLRDLPRRDAGPRGRPVARRLRALARLAGDEAARALRVGRCVREVPRPEGTGRLRAQDLVEPTPHRPEGARDYRPQRPVAAARARRPAPLRRPP